MNTYSFTYIIGYRHSLDKFNNLKRVLDWINGFSNVEVIVVEQDTHSKISHIPLKCKHIFLKSDKPFNKSWSYNIGLKNSNSNIIGFGDTNLTIKPSNLIDSVKSLENYEMVSAHSSIIELFPNENNYPFEELFKINRQGQLNSLCNGICFFRRQSINKIGGWNESFIGLGGSDEFQSHKVNNFLSNVQLESSAIQFMYNKEQINPINERILQQLTTLSKEDLVKTVNASVQKNGMKNLYDTF